MMNRLIMLLLFCAPGVALHAAENGTAPNPVMPAEIDLATAVNTAYQNNPLINEARERLVEQEGLLISTESLRLPRIGAYGLYQQEDSDRSGSFGGGGAPPDEEYWRAGIDFSQPLYAGGQLNATVQSRRLEGEALEAEVQSALSRSLTQVHLNFFNALLTREVIGLQEESIALLQEQLTLASNRYVAGTGARFDVLQAEVRLANARPALIRARNDNRIAIDRLRTSLGSVYAEGDGPESINLSGDFDAVPDLPELDALLQEAMQERPDLRAFVFRREAAEQNVRRAAAQRSLDVDLVANYGWEHDRYNDDADPLEGWQAGIQARLPIWESGRIRGEVAQAKSRQAQVEWRENSARLAAELDVRNNWNRAREAREIMEASELVIAQAEEAMRLADNRYRVGAITQLDVLASQLDFTKARLDHITAIHDYRVALVELDQATGRIPGAELLEQPTP
jgi:outer membrane protein